MILFSYPTLFGLADNNPYGLKIFAFLKLCGLPFEHRHILDASSAPRAQLPYLTDNDQTIGDSDAIVAYVTKRYDVPLDGALSPPQRDMGHLIGRMLDDLYWVMSYSRWKDQQFWPQFRDAMLQQHPELTAGALDSARDYNFKRYHYQGIGRYDAEAAYARGIADLSALGNLLGDRSYLFGAAPGSVDAAIYGFIANIYHFDIDTPLKAYLRTRPNLVAHCAAMHALVT
ncbi:glutathione S-transferase C-terminal domain-containing protein [Acidocella sp.]|jgi:glutathione S-transferase|uniref:glutathione S-transferase C-terminal domain-containing protein n=1 Tax=Acidocella sp. TaxID=50710 RepID=UPI002F417805